LTFANVPATAPRRTIRPGLGKPTTIITCQIVIAERRRTMVEKSRRQQLPSSS